MGPVRVGPASIHRRAEWGAGLESLGPEFRPCLGVDLDEETIDFCAVGLISEAARPVREVSAGWCRCGHRLLPVGQFTDLSFESLDGTDYIRQAHLTEPHRHAVVAARI